MNVDDIVKALANVDPYRREVTQGASCFVCVLCGGTDYVHRAPEPGKKPSVDHEPDCPWVAAVGIVSHPPLAKPGGGFYPSGVGWRVVNHDCIEVDGTRFVFDRESAPIGEDVAETFVSREIIGADRLVVTPDTDGQAIADMIRERLEAVTR